MTKLKYVMPFAIFLRLWRAELKNKKQNFLQERWKGISLNHPDFMGISVMLT
jgi:hypothetical protein